MPPESSRPVDRAKDHAQRFAMMVAARQSAPPPPQEAPPAAYRPAHPLQMRQH